MKESEKQYFEDLIVKATQSGKKETSGLVADITNKVTSAVKEQVIITVNGKIDEVKKHLHDQDLHLDRIDKKLDQLKPVSQFIVITRILRKFLIWVATPVGIIGAIIKWLK
jgi:ABC-type transport system involved in cytochrome bd biosynthesis fused ATPase/permease subunit